MIKRCTLSLLVLFAMITSAWAKDVTPEAAKTKAQEIMKSRFASAEWNVADVTPVMYEGQKAYYIVSFSPEGWTLISADDNTEPLIGFSDTGRFVAEGMPSAIENVVNCFSRRIVERSRFNLDVAEGWETGTADKAKTRASEEKVEPLIKVKWNQTGAYNKYCPKDANGQAVVGCVAVAMAQAMSVARWPQRPVGSFSYTSDNYGTLSINYDEEPAYNWDDILAGANGKDDVARLLWHCGVSLRMDYGVDGSGTQTSYIPAALQRNFSYPASVKFYNRSSYTEAEWHDIVYGELAAGRAVCFSGADPKKSYGHCFNLDGYNNGAYHVNWGWGGSNDGYFELNALKDLTMGMDYSDPAYQGVVVGIRQPSNKPSNITLSNTTVEAGQPAGTVVATITVENEATETPTYTWEILGPYNPILHKRLPAPFKVVDDKLVTTEVLKLSDGNRSITITVTDQNGESVSRNFTIKVVESSGIDEISGTTDCKAIEHYDVQGRKTTPTSNSVTIVKYKMNDGSVKTEKRIN